MTIGFNANPYEKKQKEEYYRQYIESFARIGVRDMGVVEGIVTKVEGGLMIVNKKIGDKPPVTINLNEISLFEPRELIVLS